MGQVKPVDVNEDSFEGLLAYDDLFLDYFNVFLQLPAFPQPFYYNRLTGTFHEVEEHHGGSKRDSAHGGQGRRAGPALYAPGDEERERLLDWAKTERLPLFLRTKLYLEYKLCKLLTRPLHERNSANRLSSSGVRGYSRQTVSYTTTSTDAVHSRAPSIYGSAYSWQSEAERAGLFKYLRPGSRCVSLPPMFGLARSPSFSSHDPLVQSITVTTNQPMRGEEELSAVTASREKVVNEEDNDEVSAEAAYAVTGSPSESCGEVMSPRKKAPIQIPSATQNSEHTIQIDGIKQIDDRPASVTAVSPGSPIEADIQTKLSINYETNHDNEKGSPYKDRDPYGTEDDQEQSIVGYGDERYIDDEMTQSQLREMEGKHRLSLQQLKEHLLGSRLGAEAFKRFLKGTVGEDMLSFWLDCELYRDNMLALGDQTIDIAKTNMFSTWKNHDSENLHRTIISINTSPREYTMLEGSKEMVLKDSQSEKLNIQDKYRFKLTTDAQEQIRRATGDVGLSESIFTRTQYDVLRRLRSYWVPRFIIHQEYTGDINYQLLKGGLSAVKDTLPTDRNGFLPAISVSKSLPVRPDSCIRLNTTRKDWRTLVHAGRQTASSISPNQILESTAAVSRPLSDRFHVSLACDKEAGRPFQKYLEGQSDSQLLANLLFWQEVTDYGLAEDRTCDRLLRIGQAWSIFSKYLLDSSVWYIGLPPGERDFIHSTLLMTSDFVEAATFERAQDQAMRLLQREWLCFLREDLKTFLRFRNRPEDRVQSGISRHSSASRLGDIRGKQVQTKEMASGDAVARKKAARARKKKQAAMQRKLMKQVKARQLANKKKGQEVTEEVSSKEGINGQKTRLQEQSSADGGSDERDNTSKITFRKMYQNKPLMNSFKNHLQDFESKEMNLAYQMYTDLDAALKIPEGLTEKRAGQFKLIVSTYFDPSSKKSINLSHDVLLRLARDGNRPTTRVMEAAYRHSANLLDTAFQSFWNSHVEAMEEQGITGDAVLSRPVDITFRSESTRSLIAAYKKRRRGRAPLSGQQMPNVQDKNEFQAILAKAGRGVLPGKLMAFHRYLIEYGEKEGMALLDKDLLFYLEAQKFKEALGSNADVSLLKRKVEVIMDCFFESPLVNGGVMVDVPTDVISKLNKTVDNFLKDKGRDSYTIFDDGQHAVFKEMVPYWAAFTRRYQEPDEPYERVPSSKRDRRARERLRKFIEMKEPPKEFSLPAVSPTSSESKAGATGVSFSLSDGLKWKQTYDPGDLPSDDENATLKGHRSSSLEGRTPLISKTTRLQTKGSQLYNTGRGKMGTVHQG